LSKITVGVLSDTHSFLDPELVKVFREHDVELIAHGGDIGDQTVIDELEEVAPVHAVRGNIDGGELRFLPEEEVFQVGPTKWCIRHISGKPSRPTRAAREFISREKPDVFVCGHSHIPVVGRVGDGTLWINPGACGRVGFHHDRFALLMHVDEDTGELGMDRVHLGPRSKRYE
jgi:hypothetical protein